MVWCAPYRYVVPRYYALRSSGADTKGFYTGDSSYAIAMLFAGKSCLNNAVTGPDLYYNSILGEQLLSQIIYATLLSGQMSFVAKLRDIEQLTLCLHNIVPR